MIPRISPPTPIRSNEYLIIISLLGLLGGSSGGGSSSSLGLLGSLGLELVHGPDSSLEIGHLTHLVLVSLVTTGPGHVQVLLSALVERHQQSGTPVSVRQKNLVLLHVLLGDCVSMERFNT